MLKFSSLIGVLAIASCGLLPTAEVSSEPSPTPEVFSSPEIISQAGGEESTPGAVTEARLTITPTSIGPASLGMTLAELRQAIGDWTIGEPESWMVDFDVLPVLDGGEVLFYVLYGNWQPIAETDRIEFLVTDNPAVQTPDGIGPGSTVADAAAVYGTPTLGYNIETHSREVLQFADLLWSDYSFEPKALAGDDLFAGIYDESEERTYQETNEYRDDAVIESILIDTRGE